ncbi:MAG: hypothetical protein D6762_01185 [Candidatus Neomarinimicrobiota bacterium]|nr:MAG: hypothetical protein D6762_01185 [Candidatus Neomarinimicrobiota bacterium]
MDQSLESTESRQKYLEEKFDDLLEVVNEQYNKALLDVLVERMEKTILDFNDEINSLMEQIKANTEKKNQLLQKLKEHSSAAHSLPESGQEEDQQELSAWERKLEGLD